MKRILALLLSMACLKSEASTTLSGAFSGTPSTTYQDFYWDVFNYSDLSFSVVVSNGIGSTLELRAAYPRRGTNYIDVTSWSIAGTTGTASLARTNLPAPRTYWAELLSSVGTESHVVAAGKININYSVFSGTNSAYSTNPVTALGEWNTWLSTNTLVDATDATYTQALAQASAAYGWGPHAGLYDLLGSAAAVSNALAAGAALGATSVQTNSLTLHTTNTLANVHGGELDPVWAAVSNTVTTGAAAGATAVQRAGDTMTGTLDMGTNLVSGSRFGISPAVGAIGVSNYYAGHGAGNSDYDPGRNFITAGTNCGYIGYLSGHGARGANNHYSGNMSGYGAAGDYNHYSGYQSGYDSDCDLSYFAGAQCGQDAVGYLNHFYGFNAGVGMLGDRNHFCGYQAGNTAYGNRNSFYGRDCAFFSVGSSNFFCGDYVGQYSQATNSAFGGVWAGNDARGIGRGYWDVYLADPSYAADGATNDTIFLDSDGKLHLGGGPGRAEHASAGGVLRGAWGLATHPDLTNTVALAGSASQPGHTQPASSITNLPSPGCTTLTGTNFAVSGATFAYNATSTNRSRISVSATAPRYTYSLDILGTNAIDLAAGLQLRGTWTVTGTNIVTLVPYTGTVWSVFGRGL